MEVSENPCGKRNAQLISLRIYGVKGEDIKIKIKPMTEREVGRYKISKDGKIFTVESRQ